MIRHSTTAHTAYHDLLRRVREEEVSTLLGSPRLEKRKGRGYWYDSYRIGTSVHKRYIGEDTAEMRDMIDQHDQLATQRTQRQKDRTRLVRLLRAEGFLPMDGGTGGLLSAMAKAGVFRLGGTIVGTHAFRLYEGELGIRFTSDDFALTDDIDIASFEQLSLALGEEIDPKMDTVLRDFSFAPVPAMDPAKIWRWKQSRSETLVEFLTPSFEETEGLRDLPALGVSAQSLHYLNYLLAEPIWAVGLYRSGVLVQIPRPERFAIHKLIISERRKDQLKSLKDKKQAAFLIEALATDRPDDLNEAYQAALTAGPKWRNLLEKSLKPLPKIAEILTGPES